MALTVEDTKILTFDGTPRALETCSENVKKLVRFYDHWKEEEILARAKLLQIQTAMRSMAEQIAAAVKADDDEAEKKTNGAGEETTEGGDNTSTEE